jgi:hypothetical protein
MQVLLFQCFLQYEFATVACLLPNFWDNGVPQYLMERLMMPTGQLQGALRTAILCAIVSHHELGGRPGVCKD